MAEDLPSQDDLIAGNRRFMERFAWGGLHAPPIRRLAVLTCMDSRYAAQTVLGLEQGNAHVLRNAGGRATDDAIRSLVLSAHALGTRGCVVIHHTKCGLSGENNEELWKQIREATGQDASSIDFLPFDDLEESVREDVRALRQCTLFPEGYVVLGFTYDVDTGELTPIEV